ncbi:MAG: hypothetical protein ACQEXV_04805 [Bacillota bacterium]
MSEISELGRNVPGITSFQHLDHGLLMWSGELKYVISGQQAIYLEESMRLDADEKFPSYKLSSDSTFYSNNVKTRDVRPS